MCKKHSIFKYSKKKPGRRQRSPLPAPISSNLPKIIDISALATTSEPQYFIVHKNQKKETPPEFKSIGEYIYEIRWGLGELANPDADPVGVFGYSGNRRYIWQNKFWAELDLFAAPFAPSWPREEVMSLIYPLNEEFDIN